jgi:hypothetical protein
MEIDQLVNDVSIAGKLPLTQLNALADGLVLPHR